MADTTQQMAAAEEKKEDAVPQQAKAHRMLQVSILRYNPADPDSVPHLQTYSVSETDSMTLYILLNELRDTQDPSSSSTSFAVPVFAVPAQCSLTVNRLWPAAA